MTNDKVIPQAGTLTEERLDEAAAFCLDERNWEPTEQIMFRQLLEPYKDIPQIAALLEERNEPR